jgi:hypothetical protein
MKMLSTSSLRKYLSLIMMMFFLFNIVGYYLWFSYLKITIQKEVQEEISRGLDEKDLTLITVPEGDQSGICWIKPGKEFTYRGEMYDVVKIRTYDKKKFIYCINDTREKKLITDFSKNNESVPKARKILSSFQYIYFPGQSNWFHIMEPFNNDYCMRSFPTISAVREVSIPPPKFLFTA